MSSKDDTLGKVSLKSSLVEGEGRKQTIGVVPPGIRTYRTMRRRMKKHATLKTISKW